MHLPEGMLHVPEVIVAAPEENVAAAGDQRWHYRKSILCSPEAFVDENGECRCASSRASGHPHGPGTATGQDWRLAARHPAPSPPPRHEFSPSRRSSPRLKEGKRSPNTNGHEPRFRIQSTGPGFPGPVGPPDLRPPFPDASARRSQTCAAASGSCHSRTHTHRLAPTQLASMKPQSRPAPMPMAMA